MTGRGGRASFTDAVVAELAPHIPPLPCCRAALVEGMLLTAAPDVPGLVTTRPAAARAALQALHASGVRARVERRSAARRPRYAVLGDDLDAVPAGASARPCCRRSRLRGAFLAAGSVARPDGAPHLEILCRDAAAAAVLAADLEVLEVSAAVAQRRRRPLVLVRSSEQVGAALSTIGAQAGRLRFEEGRVVRDLRAGVNRRTNTETANLRRTVAANVRQAEAIAALRADVRRWEALPPAVREAGELRARHPQDALGRLAERAGCSRSAMAGRLRRLVDAAAEADVDGA